VGTELVPAQRRVAVAIVLDDVPLDTLASGLGSSSGAICVMIFGARLKQRAALAANS
jgi:RNA polymerase sigma-70 factor, ECF subfamily